MDGETYSGSLTESSAATVDHLFQPGYVVKIRIISTTARTEEIIK